MLLKLIKIKWRENIYLLMTGKGKKKKVNISGGVVILVLVALFLAVFMGAFFSGLAVNLTSGGVDWIYFATAALLAFAICVIGSVLQAHKQVYEAKDNEMLLALPITPGTIIASRVFTLLLFNYFYEAIIFLPAGIVYCFFGSLSVVKIIAFCVSFLFLPFLSLTFSLLLAYLIAALLAHSRHPKLVQMLLSVAGLVLYILFIFQINFNQDGTSDFFNRHSAPLISVLGKLLPFAFIGKAAGEGSLFALSGVILSCLLPFAFAYWLLSRNFLRLSGITKKTAKRVYRAERLKESTPFRAIVNIEFKRFSGSVTYMLNGGVGLIFLPLIAVAALFKREALLQFLSVYGAEAGNMVAPGIAVLSLFVISMVTVSASALSMEGKNLWIAKILPVSGRDILLAKTVPHLAISLPLIFFTMTVFQFILPISLTARINLYLAPMALTVLLAFAGILINAAHPKFAWTNENAAVKQSMSVFLSTVTGYGCTVGAVAWLILVGSMGFSVDIALLIAGLVFAAVALILFLRIRRKGDAIWASVQE